MVKRKSVERYFLDRGFLNLGGTNHDKLKHPDGRWTTLPRHAEIPDRLFDLMKKQAGLK